MATRLERKVCVVLVVVLCAALLLVSPSQEARAQAGPAPEGARAEHANARGNLSHVVVRRGDSLWTISEEKLGPEATPRRVLEGARQIYALNRGRIGADPALILVDQELLVPQAMSERHAGAPPAHGIAESGPRDRAAEGDTAKETGPAPKTVAGGVAAEGAEVIGTPGQRSDVPVSLPALPDGASVARVTNATLTAPNEARPTSVVPLLGTIRREFASAASTLGEGFSMGSADTRAEERRLLGLGILALTLVVAALIVWKLPMRRTTFWDAQRWALASYYGEVPTADRVGPFAYDPVPLEGPRGGYDGNPDGRDPWPGAPGGAGGVRRSPPMTSPGRKGGTTNARRRAPRAKAVARNTLAVGVHDPKVRSAPLRVHASRRARKLRPRRGASKGALRPIILKQKRRAGEQP